MPNLSIPTPELSFDPIAAGLAALEMPLEVRCAPVTFPDASKFKPENMGVAGFFIYRQRTSGAATEIWNDEAKEWKPDPGSTLDSLQPIALFFEEEDSTWRGTIVANGQKDKQGNDQFQRVARGFPQYLFRAYFKSARGGFSGLSAPSPPFGFESFFDILDISSGVGFLAATGEVFFALGDPIRRRIGLVRIKNVGGYGEIEIKNLTPIGNSVIRMNPNGDMSIDCPGNLTIHCRGFLTLAADGGASLPPHGP